MFNFFEESNLINSTDALKGRQEPISLNQKHYINGRSLNGPWEDYAFCILGMGCFWGAEKGYELMDGVINLSYSYMTFVMQTVLDEDDDDYVFDPEEYNFIINKNTALHENKLIDNTNKLKYVLEHLYGIDPVMCE